MTCNAVDTYVHCNYNSIKLQSTYCTYVHIFRVDILTVEVEAQCRGSQEETKQQHEVE